MPPSPPPVAPPGPDSVILDTFTGLKNTVGPERLKATEFARAQNVDLDDAGQPRRRRGYTKKMTGAFHSLFTTAMGQTLGVRNGDLGVINPNYTFVTIHPNVGIEPVTHAVAYVQIGPTLYFSNRITSGQISLLDFTVSPWGAQNDQGFWFSPVVNPTATQPPIGGRLFGAPPLATALTYLNGRIYLASENVLWATELHLFNFVDKTKNYRMFESKIKVLGAVTDGLYVGTESDVWFLGGGRFHDGMRRVPIMQVGAISGTLISVPAELIHPIGQGNPEQPIESKNAVVFQTQSGIVVGLDGGQTFNLTQTDFLFPGAQGGAGFFRRQDGINSYISVLDSGGTAASNVRFGDHLDAQLIRGPGV